LQNGQILFNWVNPLRAGLVDRPEDYRWNSLGYHVQAGNKDNFLSLDFGLKEFGPRGIRSAVTSEFHRAGIMDAEERLRGYRRYVYEAGALDRPDRNQAKVIDNDTLKNERQTPVKSAALVFRKEFNGVKNYEISRVDRFRYRTRYFTDSGIIGTKEFVSENYKRFKDVFMSKREKIPRAVAGLDGVYSLKRLAE